MEFTLAFVDKTVVAVFWNLYYKIIMQTITARGVTTKGGMLVKTVSFGAGYSFAPIFYIICFTPNILHFFTSNILHFFTSNILHFLHQFFYTKNFTFFYTKIFTFFLHQNFCFFSLIFLHKFLHQFYLHQKFCFFYTKF